MVEDKLLAAGLGVFATGAALLIDDYKDFGLDGTERDPPYPHHWLVGAILMIAGIGLTGASAVQILSKIQR